MISFNPQSQSSSGLINENNCTESEQPSIQKSSPREGILHSCITKIGQYLVEGSKKLTQVFVRPSKLALDDLTKAIGTSTLFRRTSYLTEMLPFFSLYNYEDALSLGTFNKYTEQAILGYWERKLTSFKQVCTLYKEKKLAQGESEEEINKELSRVIGEAEQIAETDVEKAVDVLRNIEYLQSLFKLDVNCLRFDQLSTIADMRFRIEYLFKNPPPIAIPLKDACRIFFEKNKNAEYPDIYVKKFFCFMKLLEMTPPNDPVGDFKDTLAKFLATLLSKAFSIEDICSLAQSYIDSKKLALCLVGIGAERQIERNFALSKKFCIQIKSWFSLPENHDQLKELFQSSEQQRVDAECQKFASKDLYNILFNLVKSPLRAAHILSLLPSSARALLQDKDVCQMIEIYLKNKKYYSDGELAYKIHCYTYLIIWLKQIGLNKDEIGKIVQLRGNALLNLVMLSTDNLKIGKILFAPEDKTNILRFIKTVLRENIDFDFFCNFQRFYYLNFGGPHENFEKVISLYHEFKQLPTEPAVKFYETLAQDDLENFWTLCINNLLSIPSTSEDVLKVKNLLNRKKLVLRLVEIFKERPQDALKLQTDVIAFLDWLKNPTTIDQNESPYPYLPLIFSFLTKEERRACYEHLPTDRITLLYLAEREGFLEEDISLLPLSSIPNLLLLRFLSSKPFAATSAWLLETIETNDGCKLRRDTLTPEQIKAILFHFPRYESPLPRSVWMEFFHVTEEEVERMHVPSPYATRPEALRTAEVQDRISRMSESIKNQLDVFDPYSLFVPCFQGLNFAYRDATTIDVMLMLLGCAPEEHTICGGRPFLEWGNADPVSSPCTASEAVPLYGRYRGQPLTLYPKGVFNELTFGVDALSLRRRLFELTEKRTTLNSDGEIADPETKCELERLAHALVQRYPFLPVHLNGNNMPPVEGLDVLEVFTKNWTFASLFKDIYHSGLYQYRNYCAENPDTPPYDCNNPVHRYANIFLTLLALAKIAKISHENDIIKIIFTRNVFFLLKSLRPEDFQVLPEDNPGITNLASFAADYPLHTISPITPVDITPEAFEEFAKQVQALDEATDKALFISYIKFASQKIPDESPYEEYFNVWKSFWPKGVTLEGAGPIMTRLAKNYFGYVDVFAEELVPNKIYLSDRNGINRFSKEEDVSACIRHLGSYASALSKFFIAHEPDRHDGNCAINAFLLGLHGPESYQNEPNSLSASIQQFRQAIVQYANVHKDDLIAEFGERAITNILTNYGENRGRVSWTTCEVWAIAARLYSRQINVFNCDTHDGYFKTNDRGEVVPFDEEHEVFKPLGPSTEPPIDLLFWGPHYVCLERRNKR